MSEERDTSGRLVNFQIFLGMTIVTFGMYPMYVRVSRADEQNALFGLILMPARRNWEGCLG